MLLFYSPGACSLADHIALHEAGLTFDRIKVDLKTHTCEDGRDYYTVNPKGYVPALALDDGQVLAENLAVLAWIADQAPALAPAGALGRYRLLEMLAFISTEIHKGFKPYFKPGVTEAEKDEAAKPIAARLGFLAERLGGDYLFGDEFTVADAYLFVMLRWSKDRGIALPDPLGVYFDRVKARPAVALSLRHEGLA